MSCDCLPRLGPRQETQEEFNERIKATADRLVAALKEETVSWSNSWIGKPSAIKAAFGRYSDTLSGNSKEEFEAARPALETLLDLNSNKDREPVIHLDASGHAYVKDGERQYSGCNVTLRSLGVLTE